MISLRELIPELTEDNIADYYFNLTESFEIVKTDAIWNQEEYEVIFNKPKDWRSDIYTGRNISFF